MSQNTLKIEFEDWGDFKKRVRKALKSETTSKTQRNSIVFGNVTSFQKFMTEQKLAILATIRTKEPKSIYKLAELVDRDFANVQRDCVALESMGFIKFLELDDSKKTKQPRLAFDYKTIEVHMPNVVYSHNLGKAA